jgi:hypothetical protein
VVSSTEALDAVPGIDAEPDKYRIPGWELEPGDGLPFHGLTVLSAHGNRSPRPNGFLQRSEFDRCVRARTGTGREQGRPSWHAAATWQLQAQPQ